MPTRKLIQAINEESRLMLPTTASSCKYHLIGPSCICCYAKKGDLCVLRGLEGLGDRPGSGGGQCDVWGKHGLAIQRCWSSNATPSTGAWLRAINPLRDLSSRWDGSAYPVELVLAKDVLSTPPKQLLLSVTPTTLSTEEQLLCRITSNQSLPSTGIDKWQLLAGGLSQVGSCQEGKEGNRLCICNHVLMLLPCSTLIPAQSKGLPLSHSLGLSCLWGCQGARWVNSFFLQLLTSLDMRTRR